MFKLRQKGFKTQCYLRELQLSKNLENQIFENVCLLSVGTS